MVVRRSFQLHPDNYVMLHSILSFHSSRIKKKKNEKLNKLNVVFITRSTYNTAAAIFLYQLREALPVIQAEIYRPTKLTTMHQWVCACACACACDHKHPMWIKLRAFMRRGSRVLTSEGGPLPHSCNRFKIRFFFLLDRLPYQS